MATVLRATFSRAAPSVPASFDAEDGPLAEVMHEVGVALEADALIVAWHQRGGDKPVLLFTEGVDSRRADSASLEPAILLSDAPAGTSAQWCMANDNAHGGELTTSIETEEGVVTITGCFNRLGSASRTRAREALARLLPMVRPFVSLWTARRAVLSRVRGLTAAVNKSDIGMLLVDRHAQLLFANAAAEALIAENDGIRRQGRMLSGGKLADTLRLQATVEHAIRSQADPGRDQGAPVIALTREGRRPLLAAVMASGISCDQGEESAAIIYLCDPDQDLTGLVEPTCKLYGLSPVETRLACLLARGVSLAEAAEAMRVREQTARSYLKQIFLKTETRRQAELVWLMLKSSVRATSAGLSRLA